MAKIKTYPIHGGPWLKVKKTDEEDQVLEVKNDKGNKAEGPHDITQLRLTIGPPGEGESALIIWMPDDTIIRTKKNPTCTWYFFQGQWWKVCD